MVMGKGSKTHTRMNTQNVPSFMFLGCTFIPSSSSSSASVPTLPKFLSLTKCSAPSRTPCSYRVLYFGAVTKVLKVIVT